MIQHRRISLLYGGNLTKDSFQGQNNLRSYEAQGLNSFDETRQTIHHLFGAAVFHALYDHSGCLCPYQNVSAVRY